MLSFKTELKLNNKQRSLMAQHAGCARFAWNWGVALTSEILEYNRNNPDNKQKFPTAIDLHKKFVAEVKSTNQWLYNSSKCTPQQALRDLRLAWDRCFKKIAKPPKFKKKGRKDGFYLEGSIKGESNRIKLPRIGWVKTYEQLPTGEIKNVRITRQADRWFPSSQICSHCGHQQKMPLSERTYHCQKCETEIDRDLNAALNLESLAVSSTVNACGELHKPVA